MTRTPVQIVQGFIDHQLEAGNSAKHQLLCNVRDKIKEECMTNEPNDLQTRQQMLEGLERAKVKFQQRAIAAVMDFPDIDRQIEDIDDE